jgi:hypothetical protein
MLRADMERVPVAKLDWKEVGRLNAHWGSETILLSFE